MAYDLPEYLIFTFCPIWNILKTFLMLIVSLELYYLLYYLPSNTVELYTLKKTV